MRAALALAVLAAAVLAASASAGAPRTALTITYWPDGDAGQSLTWTLRCGPVGGTHPQRGVACRKLNATAAPFRPVPKEAACTMQYGGPDVAFVRGIHRGNRVWSYFRLRDGCEIERWKRLVPLLPAPGAA